MAFALHLGRNTVHQHATQRLTSDIAGNLVVSGIKLPAQDVLKRGSLVDDPAGCDRAQRVHLSLAVRFVAYRSDHGIVVPGDPLRRSSQTRP